MTHPFAKAKHFESSALGGYDDAIAMAEIQEHRSLMCQNGSVGKRRNSRERIEAQIVELGRRHLVEHGAAGLSLRAIARDLGMVSSAVYRYVSSRDELLTLLLVDAYSDLADTVDRARDAVPDVWSDDVIAIAHAARSWAIAHPASWALLYGSPVPGYHAPAERTVGPGTRVVSALFDAVAAGIATGDIMLTNSPAPQPMSSDFERLRQEFGFPGDDPVIAKCFAIWAGVLGAISLEVFGQYGADTLSDPKAVFDIQVRLLVGVLTQPDVGAIPYRTSAPN
jgi:AcrR family transcriptional regulator